MVLRSTRNTTTATHDASNPLTTLSDGGQAGRSDAVVPLRSVHTWFSTFSSQVRFGNIKPREVIT
jgi:hypothetical protein